jgi:hypothetical protein
MLAEAEGQAALLESHYDNSVAEQAALHAAVELTTSRLARAGHLTPTMHDEGERWNTALQVRLLIFSSIFPRIDFFLFQPCYNIIIFLYFIDICSSSYVYSPQ